MASEFSEIQELVEEFKPLHDRMDEDRSIYNMDKYYLKDIRTGEVATDVVNITMNDARVFAEHVQWIMNEAPMQVTVTGKNLQDSDTSIIEAFDKDLHYEIDQQLIIRGIASQDAFLIEQACLRGILAGRYITWEDKGEFVPDMVLCDSRYLVYEHGRRDLNVAAFRTTRTKADIMKQYPNAVMQGTSKRGVIWEKWTKDKFFIYLSDPTQMAATEGQLLKEGDNKFGEVPFIIQGIGAGSMLQDDDSMKHRHESIFANNRLIIEHVNMMASILQTLNYMTFNRVHQWESDAGTMATKSPEPGQRKTIPIDKGTKGLFPVEIADIKNATRLFYALIMGSWQRGSLPHVEYGNLTFQLSAVAIGKLTSMKNTVVLPRFEAISRFYNSLHRMAKAQYIKGGYKAELGEEGLRRTYSTSDLDKKYQIKHRFNSISPEQNVANYAIAQQAKAVGISTHTVYTDILKLDNPDGEIMKGKAEEVERIEPSIALMRYGLSLINKGTEESFLEADLVKHRIKLLLQQQLNPQEQEVSAGKSKSPPAMMPLLDGGGGRGAPATEDDMQDASPEESLRREERRAEIVRKHESEG